MPLFPIIERTKFLEMYTEYSAKDECSLNPIIIVQINLAFSIAATSTDYIPQDTRDFETAWESRLTSTEQDSTFEVLRQFLLVQLFYMVKPDHAKLLCYWEKVVAIFRHPAVREDLVCNYNSQSDREIRSSIGQSLYTLDSFSAALLGLPKKLKIEEFNENLLISTKAETYSDKHSVTMPPTGSQCSAALALFRSARILSKVLDELYPAVYKPDTTLNRVMCLEKELDAWYEELPSHLRMHFVHD